MPVLVAVLAISMLAAGCGSSKKSSSPPAITKAEFLKKGNAICKAGNKQINAGGNKIFGTNQKKADSSTDQEVRGHGAGPLGAVAGRPDQGSGGAAW